MGSIDKLAVMTNVGAHAKVHCKDKSSHETNNLKLDDFSSGGVPAIYALFNQHKREAAEPVCNTWATVDKQYCQSCQISQGVSLACVCLKELSANGEGLPLQGGGAATA